MHAYIHTYIQIYMYMQAYMYTKQYMCIHMYVYMCAWAGRVHAPVRTPGGCTGSRELGTPVGPGVFVTWPACAKWAWYAAVSPPRTP